MKHLTLKIAFVQLLLCLLLLSSRLYGANEQTYNNLNTLCRVWGFVKYHHPAIEKGEIDLDQELFDLLPEVMNAQSSKERNEILADWVAKFGVVKNFKAVKDTVSYFMLANNSWIEDRKELGKKLSGFLKDIERAERTGVSKYIDTDEGGYTSFSGEKQYDLIQFNNLNYRLLTLFRFWNAMRYYFPYVNITDKDWDDVLEYFIPKFVNYTSDKEFYFTLREMVASLNDTHATFLEPNEYSQYFAQEGIYKFLWFPIKTVYSGNNLIVTDLLDTTASIAGFCKGVVIQAVDGVTVEEYFAKLGKYVAHSTESGLINTYAPWYLSSNKPVVNVSIERDGKPVNLEFASRDIKRIYTQFSPVVPEIAEKGYSFVNDTVGYIYAGKVNAGDLDRIMEQLKDTKEIVLDMRCYLGTESFERYWTHFIKDSVCAVKGAFPYYQVPGAYISETFKYKNPDSNKVYKGKVTILANHNTISASEYLIMWLQASPNVTVIGSPTAGTDGDKKYMPFPYKNMGFFFTSWGVYYPNGSPTQRVGIRLDKEVNPTLQGVKEEIDREIRLTRSGK